MKVISILCLYLACCSYLCPQSIQIKYAGDPLPDKDRRQIEQFLNYEIEFYTQLGLPDTLSLQLTVFNNRKDGLAYLDSIGIHPSIRTSGLYSVRRKEAFLLGREKGREESLAIIYHELSHHLTRLITGERPPAWLMEGLAEYFAHCRITKKGLKHTLPSYATGRVRTMYMLEEVNLKSFVDSDKSKFMKKQRTEEQYTYILAHSLVTYWIEKVPGKTFKEFISALQDTADDSPVSHKIDRIYPGGIQQLEKDFAAFANNRKQ